MSLRVASQHLGRKKNSDYSTDGLQVRNVRDTGSPLAVWVEKHGLKTLISLSAVLN